jgi:hypothetical protein
MIFGIPLFIADKPNLRSIFDFKSKLLYYYPINTFGEYLDIKTTSLACTLLRFDLDWLKEY